MWSLIWVNNDDGATFCGKWLLDRQRLKGPGRVGLFPALPFALCNVNAGVANDRGE